MAKRVYLFGRDSFDKTETLGIILAKDENTAVKNARNILEKEDIFDQEEIDNIIAWEMSEDDAFDGENPDFLLFPV